MVLYLLYRRRAINTDVYQLKELSAGQTLLIAELQGELREKNLLQQVSQTEQEKAEISGNLSAALDQAERNANLIEEIKAAIKAAPIMPGYIDSLVGLVQTGNNRQPDDWSQLLAGIETVRPGFNNKLLAAAPDLSVLDRKICAFLVMNLSTKTIAQMLNITEASLLNRRSSIRAKLNLKRSDDLIAVLMNL